MRRVVVTGLGVVAPNGIGKDAFWSACVNGRSGVGPIRSFDASAHPVRVAAEVPDFDMTAFLAAVPAQEPQDHGPSGPLRRRRRRTWRCRTAAWSLTVKIPNALGVVMGTGLVPIDLPEVAPLVDEACDENGRLCPDRLGKLGGQALFPLWILKYLPNMMAAHISLALNAQGPNSTITTACAAGTQAVGEAFPPDRPRRRRHRAGRRRGQPDRSAPAAGLLRRRRPQSGEASTARSVAALRRRARRLRARRRSRRCCAGRAGAGQEARGHDLCRGPRPGQQFRRLCRDEARPRSRRSGPGHLVGPARGARRCVTTWTTSTPTAPARG